MKVALVTGVSSGIGRATAGELTDLGFKTFGTVRSEIAPQRNVEHVRLDVRDDDSAKAAVAEVLDRAGRIDVLINSAGSSLLGALEETSIEEAHDLFETNFFGVFRMTQAVLPAMRAQGAGRIVNISSVLGFLPAPFLSVYAATKHAVEGYSETLDHEVRSFGIRVVVVEPGFTRTQLGHNSASLKHPLPIYDEERSKVHARLTENIDRGADPAVVARVVARAVTARSPRLRYQAGGEARSLRILRSIAPTFLLDRGIRKEFGLGAPS
ncbi:MAG TPA: oxidoreductase [Thermoanaerobaculia bacterium]|jgi:NAD(P)-dependent dehydrogenase (short-subunit alcohol dehydrogenase family)